MFQVSVMANTKKIKKMTRPQATSGKLQATSFKLDKYIADRIRWLMGIPPGEVDEDK